MKDNYPSTRAKIVAERIALARRIVLTGVVAITGWGMASAVSLVFPPMAGIILGLMAWYAQA